MDSSSRRVQLPTRVFAIAMRVDELVLLGGGRQMLAPRASVIKNASRVHDQSRGMVERRSVTVICLTPHRVRICDAAALHSAQTVLTPCPAPPSTWQSETISVTSSHGSIPGDRW
jgi:hypothetical protein